MSSTTKDIDQLSERKELPEGWRWVKLGEVCEITAGQSPPGSTYREFSEGLPFFQGKADFGKIHPVARVWCVEPKKIAQTGDILLSVRAPVGPTNIADVECCIGRGLAAIRCGKDSDQDFILNLLRYFEAALVKKGSGSTFNAINRDVLDSFKIPLPPLPEQQRIAAILKEQMGAVEKARKAAQERLRAIKALPAAFLRQIFPDSGQPLPEGWRWAKLGDVCELNPRRPFIDRDDSDPTSFIPMESVDAVLGVVSSIRERPYGEVKKGYTFFAEADVLFSKITPCMQNGKHAIAVGLIDGIGFGTTEFHVIRPTEAIISEFIWFYVRQPKVLTNAIKHFTGAVGQQRVPEGYLAELEIPLPSLSEQQRIATIIKDKFAAVKKARISAEAELKAINTLPAALLRRAFNGEL
jgi:type I restriction enzyme S subunit